MSAPLEILLPTDRRFTDSPDVGLPECICSRCGKPIGEDEVPIRVWPADQSYEYRFHPACLGFQTFADHDHRGEWPDDNFPFDEEQLIEIDEDLKSERFELTKLGRNALDYDEEC